MPPVPSEPFVVRLVRGDLHGPGPTLLRLLLAPPSWLFAAATEARYVLYRVGVFTQHRVPRPVVSVGNLTVGGTGKTPLVEWIVSEIRMLGLNPVVLARGYGAAPGEVADELAALAANDVVGVRDPDRVRGALTAIEKHCAEALVLDDGFQHHRLAREIDVVTVDATAPFGSGSCLPRGTLREPTRALRRAGAIVVTRADQVPGRRLDAIRRRLRRVAPRAAVAVAVHRPLSLCPVPSGEEHEPAWLRGRAVLSACGIGNPAAFEATLRGLGARLVDRARFPDHHAYGPEDLADLAGRADRAGAEAIVTTQKDAVKWGEGPGAGPPALWLSVRLEVTEGAETLRELLRSALRASPGGR